MDELLFSVLIADDEFWIRENLRTIIQWEAYGMRLLTPACDGEEALERIMHEQVDVLITDINMPYLSGVELIRRVHAVSPGTVIFVLSGYSDYEYVRQSLVEGAMDYLLKPLTKAKLIEALGRATDRLLEARREREQASDIQRRLAAAASAMLDRDFSTLLHEARRRDGVQTMEARLFEYEQQFSGYRLTILKTEARVSGAEEIWAHKRAIEAAMEPELSGAPHILIHNLYHASHFLLITPLDEAPLLRIARAAMQCLKQRTGMRLQAVISRAYLSFGDLRKAYEEVRSALLQLPVSPGDELVFAAQCEASAATTRVSGAMQRMLEQAVQTRQRDWFEHLIAQTGVYRSADWTQLELMYALNTIAWTLRRGVEESGDAFQQTTMDTLAELLTAGVTREETIRDLLTQMMDEAFAAALEPGDAMGHIVSQVKSYVDAHYTEDLSLNMLSCRFAVDDSYLSKCFKQSTGMNLTLYIASRRMEQAKRLLEEGRISITDVAQAVGYDDYAYFSRVFKKMIGLSPRAYRESGGAGKEDTP